MPGLLPDFEKKKAQQFFLDFSLIMATLLLARRRISIRDLQKQNQKATL